MCIVNIHTQGQTERKMLEDLLTDGRSSQFSQHFDEKGHYKNEVCLEKCTRPKRRCLNKLEGIEIKVDKSATQSGLNIITDKEDRAYLHSI